MSAGKPLTLAAWVLSCLVAAPLALYGQNRGLASQPAAPPPWILTGENKSRVEELEKQIEALREKGKYAEAIPLAEEVLAIRRERQTGWTDAAGEPAEWYEVGITRRGLAYLRLRSGLSAEQQTELKEANVRASRAESLYSAGGYDQALSLAREALKVRRRLLGDKHPLVAASLDSLATLLQAKGEYAGAEPLLREALAMDRQLLGNEHPDVAAILNDLARLLRAKGDYAAAEPLHREALAMFRQLLGDEHPAVATGMNNLAGLLKDEGDYARAELLFREALAMDRKLLGNEHPDVAAILNNLAVLLIDKGDYAAAEPLFREALAMRRKLLGDEHPDVAICLNNLVVHSA